jgi:hypothetical protein
LANNNLIKLLDENLPNFWYKIPIPIGEYLVNVDRMIEKLENSFNLMPQEVGEFYVEQDISKIEWKSKPGKRDVAKSKKIKKEKIIDAVERNKIVFVEGGPGYGKSKMLRKLVKSYCSPTYYTKKEIIPILIDYKEVVEKFDCDLEKIGISKINKTTKECLSENCSILFAIDAIDEKISDDTESIEKFSKLIDNLLKENNIFAVLMTRHLNVYERIEGLTKNISCYNIEPLSIQKIKKFIDIVCENVNLSKRIVQDIKKSQLFHQLPKSPIAAILLANILKDNVKEIPSSLTELYSKYTELMLGRWDIQKGLQSQKEFSSALTIIMNISKYFIDNELNYLAIDEAKKFFDKYFDERNLDIDSEAIFQKLTKRSGIIQKEPINNRVFFKHRTFCEYFYALYQKEHPSPGFIDDRVFTVYWGNIFFFYFGILKDCEQAFSEIELLPTNKTRERFIKLFNMPNLLLAAYTTPYKVTKNILPKLFIQASLLYSDVTEGKVDSPLKELPPITILFLFQKIIRECYSFDFFKNALDDTIVEILMSTSLNEDQQIYAIYFVSVVLIDLKVENPFDSLIDKFKDSLPLPIEIMIKEDSNKFENKSNLLKKFEKRLSRKLKASSPELKQFINDILNEPVTNLIKRKKKKNLEFTPKKIL